MKKITSFFAVAAMCFAAVAMVSCNKGDGPKNHGGDEEEDDFEALIDIDGQFADWNGIECVTVNNPNAAGHGKQADGQRLGDLQTMKIAADGLYIYFYFELDRSHDDEGGTSWDGSALSPLFAGPLDIYIDADNDATTGGIQWVWDPIGWEYLLESATVFHETPGDLSDAQLDKFTGEDGTDIWAVDPPAKENVSINGMCAGAGVCQNNVVKYELRLLRAAMPQITGDKIAVAVVAQSDNWKLIGALPSVATEDGAAAIEHGVAVEVTLPAAL